MIVSTEYRESGADDIVTVAVDGVPIGEFDEILGSCSDATAVVTLLRGLAEKGAIVYQESPDVEMMF